MDTDPRRGFTLIELVITITIMAIVGLVVFLNLSGGKNQNDLNDTTNNVIAVLRQAQSKAVSQDQDAAWGIHFSNVTGTAPYYSLFSGSFYASGTVTARYPLPPTVAYNTATLPVGSSINVIFSPISGVASASDIGLSLSTNPSVNEYISVNDIGQVSVCNNGTLGIWQATTPYPAPLSFQATLANNGYIYSFGGWNDGAPTATVYYAPIESDGTIGPWQTTTQLPAARSAYEDALASNGYVYSFSAGTDGLPTSTVYTPINSNGTIGTWQTTTQLPATPFAQNLVNNGYLYSLGGTSGGVYTSTVYYAPINSNGTIGAWQTTTQLPLLANTAAQTAFVNDGYMYWLEAPSGVYTSTIYYAPINSNGTIGSWQTTTPLPVSVGGSYQATLVNSGVVYSFGGNNGTSYTANVYYAPINSDGTIGAWQTTTQLPIAGFYQSGIANNGYMYSLGGYTGGSYSSTIYYAPFCP